MKQPAISVIIPVYRTSDFIEKSIKSLTCQTFTDFEIILVDDCGGDDSIDKAQKILVSSSLKDNFSIVINDINKGVSESRQNGMMIASGKYILHLDSDDFFDRDMLLEMYNAAEKNDADITICDYFQEKIDSRLAVKETVNKPTICGSQDILLYLEEILLSKRACSLWNKLIKSDLIKNNKIVFLPETRDDLLVTPKVIFFAKKIAFVNKPFVHYVQYNSNSVSVSPAHLKAILKSLRDLSVFFEIHNKNIKETLLKYKANTLRRVLLNTALNEDLTIYKNYFPEVNQAINKGYRLEEKLHYHILLWLNSKGDLVLFNLYRKFLIKLLSASKAFLR